MTRSERISRGLVVSHARRGSLRAYRHGLYSHVVIADDVQAVVDLLFAAGDKWLDPRRDLPIVMVVAETLVRWSRAAAKLDSARPTADALKLYNATSQRAMVGLGMIGFSPQSAASLGLTRLEGWERARRMSEQTLGKYRPNDPPPSQADPGGPLTDRADAAEAVAS